MRTPCWRLTSRAVRRSPSGLWRTQPGESLSRRPLRSRECCSISDPRVVRRRSIGGIAPHSRMLPRRDGRPLALCSCSCPCPYSVLGPPCSTCTAGLSLVGASSLPHPCATAIPPRPVVRSIAATAILTATPRTHGAVERRRLIPSWPRRRRLVYHGPRALLGSRPLLPPPVAYRRRVILLLSLFLSFLPTLPFQGQGFCLRMYRAAACRGAVHPSSLCRV